MIHYVQVIVFAFQITCISYNLIMLYPRKSCNSSSSQWIKTNSNSIKVINMIDIHNMLYLYINHFDVLV